MMKKLLFTFFLTSLFLIVSSNTEANAASTDEELETIRESNEEYVLELTYEQAMKRIAELSGKTIEQVKLENPKALSNLPTSNIKAPTSNIMATSSNICGKVETSTSVKAKNKSHTVNLIVIVDACRNGSFQFIDNTKIPSYVGIVGNGKIFSGDAAIISMSNTGFTYLVNGYLYDHATVSHAGTTGIAALWTTTYTVTTASNYYDDIYTGKKFRQLLN